MRVLVLMPIQLSRRGQVGLVVGAPQIVAQREGVKEKHGRDKHLQANQEVLDSLQSQERQQKVTKKEEKSGSEDKKKRHPGANAQVRKARANMEQRETRTSSTRAR